MSTPSPPQQIGASVPQSPRVTVGMPVRNNAATLDRAIASVRAQTVADWRLVICDDASTDGSAEIAARAAADDGRIAVIRQPARLGFATFRTALDAATTPYFAWLAADDLWRPDFLGETLRALEAAPQAVSALPGARFLGSGRAVPNLGFLRGDAASRLRAFFAHPGGTRLYGLMRTPAAQAAFPPRAANAWDWYLVAALLRAGPQLAVPQVLLERDETPLSRYVEMVDELAPPGFRRLFPVAETSLMLLRGGHVPLRALPALAALNLRKHEEYVALRKPAAFRRLRPLYRALGLPYAAGRMGPAPSPGGRGVPARAVGGVAVTSVLACRNSAATLPDWLAHSERLGLRVLLLDHGSTDGTVGIAEARRTSAGGTVAEIHSLPWNGVFDLAVQLRRKRALFAGLHGWVLHADADEFVDPPAGETLQSVLARAERAGHVAIPMEEHLFLPRAESDRHRTGSFERTMDWRAHFTERDQKQRLFRAGVPLDTWLRTGGHTITRDPRALAPPLVLRHYPGLSLDDLRSKYLARVFARDDLARNWHATRRAAESFDIGPPPPGTLAPGPEPPPSVSLRMPCLLPRPANRTPPIPAADLLILGDGADLSWFGLRVARAGPEALGGLTRPVPVLHLLRHPADLADPAPPEGRRRASDWVRGIALARQWAVTHDAAYAELRVEEATEALRLAVARSLIRGPAPRGAAGFLPPGQRAIRRHADCPVIRAIAAPLAADLGYVLSGGA